MSANIDIKSFWTLSYGLYIVSSYNTSKLNGQISNAVFQVTDSPPIIAVCINKQELTHDCITESNVFSVSVLEEDTPMKLIGLFGFKSGRDVDKLSQVEYKLGNTGCPIVLTNSLSYFETKVVQTVETGTHTLFLGEVVAAQIIKEGIALTYDHYHNVKKGKSSEYSPVSKMSKVEYTVSPIGTDESLNDDLLKGKIKMKKYVCDVCGYVYDPEIGDPDSGIAAGTAFEDIPDSWVCPICGVSKNEFSPE